MSSLVERVAGDNSDNDPVATARRSSASSASSELDDHGMPVVPFHGDTAAPSVAHAHAKRLHIVTGKEPAADSSCSESEPSSARSDTSTVESHSLHINTATTTTAAAASPGLPSGLLSLQSPTSHDATAANALFTFEEIMSPRHQQNGKRYLGGYLNQRVSMAGGFLKSWKRKYFRLRDHGILCFQEEDEATPLFEIHFKAQSVLLMDKPHAAALGPSSVVGTPSPGGYEDSAMLATTKGKVNASLLFILKHIEIKGHQTPAHKVDVPVYLKAENSTEFHAWVENVRVKMEARRRLLTQDSVSAVLGSASVAESGRATPNSKSAVAAGTTTGVAPSSSSRSSSFHTRPGAVDRGSLSFQEQDERVESPIDAQDRTASMTNVALGSISCGPATSKEPASDKDRLHYVAGSTPDPPEFSTFRNKYLLMKEIGEGSFSIVHRAVNKLTGQLCAVKCCKFSPALEEEVAILKKLSHPNVVGLEGVYHQDEMFYVVMDYMEEGDLCEQLIKKQKLCEQVAKQIVTQVLCGLDHLHSQNILHRDLKPENILLHGQIVKIADFGLARQLPSATSMLKRSCGTLEYAAPELLCGQAYGLKSDIFSLGVVLYVLLFGAFPFTIESAAMLQRMERFPDAIDVRDMSCLHRDNALWQKVSPVAQDVLLKMLCQSDKDRISAKELLSHPWFLDSPCAITSMPTSMNAEEQELARLVDCRAKGFVELLARGLEVVKFAGTNGAGSSSSAAPHRTTISVDFVHGTISWTAARGGLQLLGLGGSSNGNGSNRKISDNSSPATTTATTTTAPPLPHKKGTRVLSLSDVQEIRVGHTTQAFQSSGNGNGQQLPAADLCFSIIATWRTLDLVVKTCSQREFVVKGLCDALDQYRAKHKQTLQL